MNPRKSKEERRRSFNGPEGSSRDSRGSRDGLQPLSGFTLDPAAAERAAATQIDRRKTAMSRLALGGNLVSSLSDMSNELVHGLAPNATAKQKMQAVMINAKERGLTVPQVITDFLLSAFSGRIDRVSRIFCFPRAGSTASRILPLP